MIPCFCFKVVGFKLPYKRFIQQSQALEDGAILFAVAKIRLRHHAVVVGIVEGMDRMGLGVQRLG